MKICDKIRREITTNKTNEAESAFYFSILFFRLSTWLPFFGRQKIDFGRLKTVFGRLKTVFGRLKG
jgi:hypothetical protein